MYAGGAVVGNRPGGRLAIGWRSVGDLGLGHAQQIQPRAEPDRTLVGPGLAGDDVHQPQPALVTHGLRVLVLHSLDGVAAPATAPAERRFADRVELLLGHVPTRVERVADGIKVTCAVGETVVDELLVATGREPNSDLLNVDAAGLECHHHGMVAAV